MARTFESRYRQMMKSWQKYTTNTCKNITAKTFQQMIRIEAADDSGMVKCVTCEKRYLWNQGFQMQSGHFVASRANAILFDERNTHPQCSRCNVFLHGNQEAYADFMLSTYGRDVINDLQLKRQQTVSFTKDELARMRIRYMDRIAAAKERIK